MDITTFMTWFIGQVVNIFKWFFALLDSITLFGFSILDVLISCFIILPIGIHLFIAIVKVPVRDDRSVKSSDRSKRKGDSQNAQS